MMRPRESDWRSVILAIGATGGALLAFSVAALMIGYAILGGVRPELANSKRSALDLLVLASAALAIGIVFLPSVYYSIRHLLGRREPINKPIPTWAPGGVSSTGLRGISVRAPIVMDMVFGLIVLLVWLAIALLAQRLLDHPVLKWLTPLLYIFCIGAPACFFVWLATRGLDIGSPERAWGALAAGIGLGITPAMIAEVLLAILGVAAIAVYVALHPDQLAAVQQLARQLQNSTNVEQALTTAGPLLTSPLAVILALLFFSVISPIIEETTKSLTVWAVFDRLTSPAQGFAIGALSGAAFGLVESLLASASPDQTWATTLSVRGASTMMHIMSASLTGWGIASLRTTKHAGRTVRMYLLAIGMHGLWNASVVVITFGSVRSALAAGSKDLIGMSLVLLGAAILVTMCLAIPLALAGINLRLRGVPLAAKTAPSLAVEDMAFPSERHEAAEMNRDAHDQPPPPIP